MDNIHIDLPNFHPTNISMAPGSSINSSEAFEHSSQLDEGAYQANRWLFAGMMIILLWSILAQIPHTITRMIASRSAWDGLVLRKTRKSEAGGIGQEKDSGPMSVADSRTAPRRLRHIHLSLPIHTIPYINLPLPQFLVVLITCGISIGVAAWCQASFLSDASRSTLVVMALMSLTAGLGMKAGGVGTWLQIGYTAVNFLHRWIGRVVLLLSTLHVIAYLVVFYKAGIASHEMAKPENYLGAMAYGGLLLVGIVSVGPIRRRWWWAFKFGHHIGILLLLAGLNYHSGDIVPYLIAIWILMLINTIFRASTTRYTKASLQILPGADSTLISFPTYTRGFIPGQHVRIRMWSLITSKTGGMRWKDAIESHPFTISTYGDGGVGVQLVVKRAGDWTRAVYDLAERNGGVIDVRCSIEGPYAGPLNFIFPAFASVIVVVGGSGISFGLGVIRGLLDDVARGRARCTNLTFVWTVRDRDNLEALAPQIRSIIEAAAQISKTRNDFHLDLILSHTSLPIASPIESPDLHKSESTIKELESLSLSVRILNSRPDLSAILGRVVEVTEKGGVGVGACGPAGMVQSMERLVRGISREEKKRVGGVEIHSEAFSL